VATHPRSLEGTLLTPNKACHINTAVPLQYLSSTLHGHISYPLTFSKQPFKPHTSVAAAAKCSLNAHSRMMLSLLNEEDVHLMEQHHPVHSLQVNGKIQWQWLTDNITLSLQ
jgi:hypothetical protein